MVGDVIGVAVSAKENYEIDILGKNFLSYHPTEPFYPRVNYARLVEHQVNQDLESSKHGAKVDSV